MKKVIAKNYIKMNDNNQYLSLGNLFNAIKDISVGTSALQRELFCSLFNVNSINATTVNNYCIGIRAIGIEYKKIYYDLLQKYQYDKNVFVPIILSLISILDEHVYMLEENSMAIINNNHNLKLLCIKLIEISKNDNQINNEFVNEVSKLFDTNLYLCIVKLLSYCILENNQPVYKQSINIKLNKEELNEYLKVKLYEGVSYINSMVILSKSNNMYACAELGSLEYDGVITGKPNYKKSFDYYLKSADKGHPKGCYMVANLILNKKVKESFDVMWRYLIKSVDYMSSAGYNTLGKCYLKGITPNKKKDIEKAKYYFKISSELGYSFAFNNLGYLEDNEEDALNYYKISADMGNSWACNKVGEYYRIHNNMDLALTYYRKALEAPIKERSHWAEKNLKKYFGN